MNTKLENSRWLISSAIRLGAVTAMTDYLSSCFPLSMQVDSIKSLILKSNKVKDYDKEKTLSRYAWSVTMTCKHGRKAVKVSLAR